MILQKQMASQINMHRLVGAPNLFRKYYMKRKIMLIASIVIMALIQKNCTRAEDTEQIDIPVGRLTEAMINKDVDLLQELLADEMEYGHSNGNVQNKTEFMEEIRSGLPISYQEISRENEHVLISGNVAIVRHIMVAKTISGTTEGGLRIGNVLVWIRKGDRWKLLGRQAYKL